jgi:hypothetical protein
MASYFMVSRSYSLVRHLIYWTLAYWRMDRLVVTYTIFKERRERALLYNFMWAVFLCLTSLIMAARDPRKQICRNEVQVDYESLHSFIITPSCMDVCIDMQDRQQGRSGSGTCTAQAFFFELFALCAVFWWCAQSLDVFLQVTFTSHP